MISLLNSLLEITFFPYLHRLTKVTETDKPFSKHKIIILSLNTQIVPKGSNVGSWESRKNVLRWSFLYRPETVSSSKYERV